MAATKISDVIVPEVFNPYVVERTAELSALQQAGIISNNAELDRLATAGGKLINMPFWDDLTGADEVLSDTVALTPAAITSDQDIAALLMRGRAWGVNDLAKALSGDDPMRVIADLVASYWARRRQATLISTLTGVFGAASMATNVHDISGESMDGVFSAEDFLDALNLLGDAEARLTALSVHSAIYNHMRKENLIEFIPDAEGRINLPTYLGRRVIVDDSHPVTDGNYTSYIFGEGAIGLGNGAAPVPTEMDRDSLQGEDYLINRQHFVLHPRGVKFTSSSVAGSSPTNAELATAANWERVYESKNVRIAAFVSRVEANAA